MSAAAEPIYLDHAATTPVDPRVAEHMSACLGAGATFGNPGSDHAWGRTAAAEVDTAAAAVGELIGGDPAGVIWTSGATEADNLALLGAGRFALARGRGHHLITGRTEHAAVLEAAACLEREGMRVTRLLPDTPDGRVSPEAVAAALCDDTALVSLMHVNNETGTAHDIAAIAALLRDHPALFHVDAAQSAGRLPLSVADWGVDLLSLSAHKLYGPKGAGVLWRRPRPAVRLQPLFHGGGQQGGVRPGTLPVALIAGMGTACRLAATEREAEARRLSALRARLRERLLAMGGVVVNGHDAGSPHILSVTIEGVHGDALRADLPRLGVSSGATCGGGADGSHVLRALGVSPTLANATLRLSFGRGTSAAELDTAAAAIEGSVHRLRAFSPVWRRREPAAPAGAPS